jgi:hypothetical protein
VKEVGRNDLLWLRVPAGTGHQDLYVRVEKESSLAAGEWRFRLSETSWSKQEAEVLKSLEGVACRDVPFEVLPQWSTPCDLYALGVLAVAIFLQNRRMNLPVALDHVLSLARQVADEHDPAILLGDRIRRIYERDSRWPEAAGPQNMAYSDAGHGDTHSGLPVELWFDTLAVMIRAFPGLGPDSRCRDFSDAPEGRLQQVFSDMAAQLESLLLRTRSLLVNDERYNREVRESIRRFRR